MLVTSAFSVDLDNSLGEISLAFDENKIKRDKSGKFATKNTSGGDNQHKTKVKGGSTPKEKNHAIEIGKHVGASLLVEKGAKHIVKHVKAAKTAAEEAKKAASTETVVKNVVIGIGLEQAVKKAASKGKAYFAKKKAFVEGATKGASAANKARASARFAKATSVLKKAGVKIANKIAPFAVRAGKVLFGAAATLAGLSGPQIAIVAAAALAVYAIHHHYKNKKINAKKKVLMAAQGFKEDGSRYDNLYRHATV